MDGWMDGWFAMGMGSIVSSWSATTERKRDVLASLGVIDISPLSPEEDAVLEVVRKALLVLLLVRGSGKHEKIAEEALLGSLVGHQYVPARASLRRQAWIEKLVGIMGDVHVLCIICGLGSVKPSALVEYGCARGCRACMR